MNIFIRKLLINKNLYIFLLIFCVVYVIVFTKIFKQESMYKGNETEFIGKVKEFNFDGNSFTFVIQTPEKIKVSFFFKDELEKKYLETKIKYGIMVKIIGELNKPINNTIPNTFNYKKYLYNNQIYYTLSATKIEIINKNISILNQAKNIIRSRAMNFITKDYLMTFILGDKTLLDNQTLDNYRVIGVTDLFAISGMHINLFSLIIMFCLKKIKVKENNRYYIVITFLLFYAFLTNYTASILRAALFYILLSFNKIFYTEISNLHIAFLTITILLLINPFLVYNLGFIYSIVTCLGLIIGSNYLKSKNYFIGIFKISLVSFLFSLPITLINFYEINLLSIINNLFFVPFITIIVYPLSLLVYILPFLEPILIFFINISETVSNLLVLYSVNIVVPKGGIIIFIVYYAFIIGFLKGHKKMIIYAIAIILLPKLSPYLNNNYEIYFLDVGQGDAILIRSPNNKENIMIDVGGKINYKQKKWEEKNKKFNLSDNIIVFLKSLGIEYLDIIISSHGDDDHIGNLPNMIDKYKIRYVMLNQGNYNELEKKVIATKIKITKKPQIKFLNIKFLETDLTNDENGNSTIILLSINNYKILFLGDAPKSKEIEIMNKYNIKDIDILKVGHHGSKTSSDSNFISVVNPKISIISSGRKNRFNHPSKETIDTLEKYNYKYLNTQNDGTIMFIINSKLKYITYSP